MNEAMKEARGTVAMFSILVPSVMMPYDDPLEGGAGT